MKFINNTLYIKSNSKTMQRIYTDSELYQLFIVNEDKATLQVEFDVKFKEIGFI